MIIDKSGQTRNLEDVDEAIKAISEVLINPIGLPPRLVVVCPTILEVLKVYKRVLEK